MGTSYKGGSPTFRSIRENISKTKEHFPITDGFFGTKGKSRDASIRNIASSNPAVTAKEFYDSIAYGGKETVLIDMRTGAPKGMKTKMADGSIITWRNVSSSDGSPAVDINIERSSDGHTVQQQKIHFVQGDEHEDN